MSCNIHLWDHEVQKSQEIKTLVCCDHLVIHNIENLMVSYMKSEFKRACMKIWQIIKNLLILQSTLSASLFMEIIVYFHLSSFLFQCTTANSMAANEPSASGFSHRLVTMGNLVAAQTRVVAGTKESHDSVQGTLKLNCSASTRSILSIWSDFQV